MKYAGIGRREIPLFVKHLMYAIGYSCAKNGMILRSGGANGADSAFELGAIRYSKESGIAPEDLMEIYLPWEKFNGRNSKTMKHCIFYGNTGHNNQQLLDNMVNKYHPAPSKLGRSRPFMERNCMQILGPKLDDPSDFVVLYCHDGDANTGGTGFAKKVAGHFDINVMDLYYPKNIAKFLDVVKENVSDWKYDYLLYSQGDITNCRNGILMNGVNCQNAMGSGVALAYANKWPRVKELYHYVNEMKLGMVQPVQVEDNTFVMNAWTQEFYGRAKKKYADEFAIKECFEKTINYARSLGIKKIYTPLIGCGLGGLDWQTEVYPFLVQIAYENQDIKIEVVRMGE